VSAYGANRDFFMHTYRNLYPEIYDFANLHAAFVASSLGAAG